MAFVYKWTGSLTTRLAIAVVVIGVQLVGGVTHSVFASDPVAAFPEDAEVLAAHSVAVLSPEEIHPKVCLEIVKYLKYTHYRDLPLDDRLSGKILDRYLSSLDGMRTYFLAEDIEAFELYRHQLDDDFQKGDLQAGYIIFNRFQRRFLERMTYIIAEIEKGVDHLDFTIDESVAADREKAAWPLTVAEQDDLWRKRVKNDVLNLILADNSREKAAETLLKRYRNNMDRASQRNSEDVFRIYMNAYALNYDPHTQYFSPRLSENFNIMMKLSLEGIGALLQTSDEYTKVVRLIPAGPADKSGLLKPGDRIVGVAQGADGEMVDVIGWRLDDVVNLIRGPKDTVVRLKILPLDAVDDHKTKNIIITRNTVKLEDQAVKKEVVQWESDGRMHRIGIIDIPTFYIDFDGYYKRKKDYRSTTRDVRRILAELKEEKVEGIIIDLRDNGGGALQEAYQLTGLFIDRGPIVQVRDVRGRVRALNDPDPDIVYDGPLAVVINRISASASEIFAGAIQDYKRGIIVGGQTFGKGTVQSLERLDQGQLKLTNAKFYRVSGESTQERGIIPDIVFPSMYDTEKIGESSLPEALPWDTIQGIPFRHYQVNVQDVDELRRRHEKRVKDDLSFKYLRAGIERLEEARSKTEISLKESFRKTEMKKSETRRLEVVNMRRAAQNKPPLTTVEEMVKLEKEEEKEAELKGEHTDTFDPIMDETKNILFDYIQIQAKAVARK